jgi:maleylpyruvate isomerase
VTSLSEARTALRERLGAGARYDDAAAPAQELSWARLGTAYFARKLNELTDRDLTADTECGLRIRRVVCEISYEARAIAQILEWARLGQTSPETDPFDDIADSIRTGVTLPAAALRHLFKHSEVHLNVEWRDLGTVDWDAAVAFPGGRKIVVRNTPWQRAQSIWLRAVDLGNGGTFRDFPQDLIDAVLREASNTWESSQSFVLKPSDRSTTIAFGNGPSSMTIDGLAADLARWVTGRGIHNLTTTGTLPDIPAAFLLPLRSRKEI